MRNIDGLQPQEAFDELLKYMMVKEYSDDNFQPLPPIISSVLSRQLITDNNDLLKELRTRFDSVCAASDSWKKDLWKDSAFHLSDPALLSIHELFKDIRFSMIDIDVRSAAFNQFTTNGLRKGLGIFTTPTSVARMMVAISSPPPSSHILDPACGTGTFLIEVFRHWRQNGLNRQRNPIWGIDKNPRMLILSELNLGNNTAIDFRSALADSLFNPPQSIFRQLEFGVDCILTNPPFGVSIEHTKSNLSRFDTASNPNGSLMKRQQSEILFLEQCFRYLRPGGSLGIVLPRSVATNASFKQIRSTLGQLGFVEALISLPPETFFAAGTQTNTIVLFCRRYESNAQRAENTSIAHVEITNVGFDTTGRPKKGNQLEATAIAVRNTLIDNKPHENVKLSPLVRKCETFDALPSLFTQVPQFHRKYKFFPLSDIVAFASNGKTPARADYSDDGLFLVKVGNLTGHGINWEPRDRNFISGNSTAKRRNSPKLMLQKGDILMTSSAHSPVYIAKKIDCVSTIPQEYNSEASFVGEVMMLRLQPGIDPIPLLVHLRLPNVRRQIQGLIRGQTAHLHPKDLLKLHVPTFVIKTDFEVERLAILTEKEITIADQLTTIMFEKRHLIRDIQIQSPD